MVLKQKNNKKTCGGYTFRYATEEENINYKIKLGIKI